MLTDSDRQLLRDGRHWRLADVLGANHGKVDGADGWHFAVWAPNARRVSVVGDWNQWDGRLHPMDKDWTTGVWQRFVPGVAELAHYEYEIEGADGRLFLKSDPLAAFSQHGPALASLTWRRDRYQWQDAAWMARRARANPWREPMAIYEVHAGSWARKHDENGRSLSYLELADSLIDYVADQGFTHLELLPITEHPFTGSWGYQVTGYYAPTSRFGTPDEFKAFIDRAHRRGLGVILDWVPAHFPKDAHGLSCFDGTCLYEHEDSRRGEHPDWGTLIFNLSRDEVRNFVLGSALHWLHEFHLDGLRVDAVASMLYLDYSRTDGQWLPNAYGGRENLEAITFLRDLNTICHAQAPGVLMIAEESTAWPGVSRPTEHGGLGFGFKWNMGWMHDTLGYFSRDPVHRRWHHHEATFSLLYAFSENYILPLSHDEVVHGKKSLLDKMPGDRWQKFAGLRCLYGWMWSHPGRKLLFMGGEIGQWREWSEDRDLDWDVLHGEDHRGLQLLVRDLNHLYRSLPALHVLDSDPAGFQWTDAERADESLFSFIRRAPDAPPVVVVINATPAPRHAWRTGFPAAGSWREILNTDSTAYAGSGLGNAGTITAIDTPWQGQPASAEVTVPPLAVVWFVNE